MRFDTCGAYAASKTHYGAGWGSSLEKAKAMADEKCEGSCKTIVADASDRNSQALTLEQ